MPRFAFASRCATRPCRRHSKPVPAWLFHAAAYRSVAGPSRSRSFPCPSLANRPYAVPSPWRRIALLFIRHALPRSAYPSPFLRRSRLSRAFPSPRRAKQISSFAALGLAGLLRRRAAPRYARPFRRLPEQIKALPLQRPSPQLHRVARQSHANPSPHNASHGSSVAHHRNAPLSRRYSGSEPSVHSKRPLPLLRHWPMPRNWP